MKKLICIVASVVCYYRSDPIWRKADNLTTVRVENFEVFLISRFSWVAHHTKFIHVEGGINTRKIF